MHLQQEFQEPVEEASESRVRDESPRRALQRQSGTIVNGMPMEERTLNPGVEVAEA